FLCTSCSLTVFVHSHHHFTPVVSILFPLCPPTSLCMLDPAYHPVLSYSAQRSPNSSAHIIACHHVSLFTSILLIPSLVSSLHSWFPHFFQTLLSHFGLCLSLSLLHDFHIMDSIGQVLLSVLYHPHFVHTLPVFLMEAQHPITPGRKQECVKEVVDVELSIRTEPCRACSSGEAEKRGLRRGGLVHGTT
ncbi:hypothetical protein U0070_013161, partial [Myodes glareolus]